MKEEADDLLLEKARAGDSRALEALLQRHQAQIYRFGMKMCRDPSDAEDVLQDTLLAMARNVRDFRGASSVSTWLYTIARSFCVKKQRRSKFAPSEALSLDGDAVEEVGRLADPARSPAEALASKRVERALEQAIAALEPMYREVLLLRDVEGLSAPEVAEVLGVGVGAVKSRLHRARRSVRAHVSPVLGIATEVEGEAIEGCPDVLHFLSQHLEGDLSPDVCAEMERHLKGCGRCRGACDSLKQTLALCKTMPKGQVPESVKDSVRVSVRGFLAAGDPSSPPLREREQT